MDKKNEKIAVIGIGMDLPMCKNPDDYWTVLENGINCVKGFDHDRFLEIQEYAQKYHFSEGAPAFFDGAFLETISDFDHEYFGIPPREASLMEPAHRLFMQTVIRMFENAAYSASMLKGKKVGIYVGYTACSFKDNYFVDIFESSPQQMPYSIVGNTAAMIPSRISHLLDLQGPVMVLDTACSSSLVAVHEAVNSILDGSCEMAVASGIKLHLMPIRNELFKLGIESSDDMTRPFDQLADGAGIGEGVASVLLKPLDQAERDQDHILGVIHASAVNHDGTAIGLTAPNPAAQTRVICDAWSKTDIEPEQIGYVELHGTATPLGDPIEFQGLSKAFAKYTNKKQFCAVGSLKSNFGHLYECAGIASFIKAILSVQRGKILPTIHFHNPNTKINLIQSPLYVSANTTQWQQPPEKRIAGISSFGLSGTNCHILVSGYEEPVPQPEQLPDTQQLLTVTAKSLDSLYRQIQLDKEYFQNTSAPFEQVVFHLNQYRNPGKFRVAMIVSDISESIQKLQLLFEQTARQNQFKQTDFLSGQQIFVGEVKKQVKHVLTENNSLEAIASGFVSGKDIDWTSYQGGRTWRKIPMPEYPFQKIHNWLEINRTPAEPCFYQKKWVETILQTDRDMTKMLVIDPSSWLDYSFLHHAGVDSGHYINYLPGPEDLTRLLEQDVEVDSILYSVALSSGRDSSGSILDFFGFCQSLPVNRKLHLNIITHHGVEVTGSEPQLYPEYALFTGLGRAYSSENVNCTVTCYDVDANIAPDLLAAAVLRRREGSFVAIRDHTAYIESLLEYDQQLQEAKQTYSLRDNGVYLITGGLGGIGYEVAKYLCGKHKNIHLFLLGRAILETGSAVENDHKKLTRLEQLKRIGGHVEYLSCDVADKGHLEQIISRIVQEHGKIHGVFHAAGVPGGQSIEQTDSKQFVKGMEAKVEGTKNLDLLTRHNPPEFIMLFSSIATVFTSHSLCAYTAANAFLDHYSAFYNRRGSGRMTTLNWSTWSETGMSADSGFTIDTLFKGMETKRAMSLLEQVIGKEINGIILGQLNLESQLALTLNKYPYIYSEFIQSKLKDLSENANKKAAEKTKRHTGKQNLKQYGKIEQQLQDICYEVLGYQDIDIHDNFFELGADSISLSHIYNKLSGIYPDKIKITDLFMNPSIAQLAVFLTGQEKEQDEEQYNPDNPKRRDVAVIGIGLDFPCADNLDEYWNILENGIDVIRNIPESRSYHLKQHNAFMGKDETQWTFRQCGYLDQIDTFDYELFGISPNDAKLIDPAGRIFLQCCWKALEDAGYNGSALHGSDTGVFLGYSANTGNSYGRLLLERDPKLFSDSLSVNQVSMTASRIAYIKDLHGPSMVVDTACSSSLVAIHNACEQIRSGKCTAALAGGVSISMMPFSNGIAVGYESDDNQTRPFAQGSQGASVGEGAGVILLKDLDRAIEDRDAIYGIIKGSAVNQDGNSFGIAAPNLQAQSDVIRKAWKDADVAPETISYIEAHGTGTYLGDTIEIGGIQDAFSSYTQKKQFCAVGSVKSNLGHLNEAAGMTGLIKLLLMMKHKVIVPTIHTKQPNQMIDFIPSSVYLALHKQKWEENRPLRAGISGFGMSGTNCHIVLQEYKEQQPPEEKESAFLFVLSAKRKDVLRQQAEQLYFHLYEHIQEYSLSAISCTLLLGRNHFNHRLAFQASSKTELLERLHSILADFDNLNEKTAVLYQNAHIVPQYKEELEKGDITVVEKQQMEEKGALLLTEYEKNGRNTEEILSLFVRGADLSWETLFSGKERRLHLPLYPFLKNHVWFSYPDDNMAVQPKQGHFHAKKWVRADMPVMSPASGGKEVSILLVCSESTPLDKLINALKDKGAGVHLAIIGSGNQAFYCDGAVYRLNGCEDSFLQLFTHLQSVSISQVIYLPQLCDKAGDSDHRYRNMIHTNFFEPLNLIKGFTRSHIRDEIVFSCFVSGLYAVLDNDTASKPEYALLEGLIRVAEQEFPNITGYLIDMDADTDMGLIADEILSHNGKSFSVSYRNNQKYIEQLEALPVTPHDSAGYDGNAAYLITGGTAGIGLETAYYLSQQGCRNLVLTGRSGFPSRENWDEIAQTDPEMAKRFEIIRSIEKNGSHTDFYSCDVSDYQDMEAVISDVRKNYGRIGGIFHSAGLAGAGFILRKADEDFEQVLRPKVKGALILEELTKADPPDFMVLYSSAVTYFGEAGQSDYVAANAYLNAFARHRNKCGRKTVCANWVSWKTVGMAVRYGINSDSLTYALETTTAFEKLHELLFSDYRDSMIGQFNLESEHLSLIDSGRLELSEELDMIFHKHVPSRTVMGSSRDQALQAYEMKQKAIILPHSPKKEEHSSDIKVQLSGKSDGVYTAVEQELGKIYSQILGYSEIDIYDNFFEMGGDSVLIMRMYQKIDDLYPNMITSADLFEFTTIASLAKYLEQNQSPVEDTPVSQPEDPASSLKIQPLASAQRRILIASKVKKDKKVYNNPMCMSFEQPKSEQAIKEALKELVMRHETLRTAFELRDRHLYQVIYPDVAFDLNIVYADDEHEVDLTDYLFEFDLSVLPLFCITIIYHRGSQILLFDFHHIVADGFSSSIFAKEFIQLLDGKKLPRVETQYSDYSKMEQEYFNSDRYVTDQQYWDQKLQKIGRVSMVEADKAVDDIEYHPIRIPFSCEMDDFMIKTAKGYGVTQYVFSIGCFFLLLHEMIQTDTVSIGTIVLGRDSARFMDTAGVFVNQVPLLSHLDPQKTLSSYFDDLSIQIKEDMRHQQYPFGKMSELCRSRGLPSDFLSILFEYENSSMILYDHNSAGKSMIVQQTGSLYDLDFKIIRQNDELLLNIAYDCCKYKEETIRTMAEQYFEILQQLFSAPSDMKVKDFYKDKKEIDYEQGYHQ